MKVGERVIHAKIRTKEAAKAEYVQARSEGRTASLLEQLDPSVFRMNVANVLPGDHVEVELRYTEMLVPEAGVYEFFFPNTMGQPYGKEGEAGVSNRKSSAAEVVDYAFNIHVHVATGMPLMRVDSPSHEVEVNKESANAADVTLSDSAIQKAGAKDFLLHYGLGGKHIQSGILAYPEGDGGYFLLMGQPPGAIPDESIAPREFIFVIDVSGSMIGAPLDLAKQLASDLFSVLRPTDLVNVEVFSGGGRVLSPKGSLHATPDTLKQVRAAISDENAGGGTELVPALETAYALPTTPGYARSVIVITDGEISAGAEAFRTVRKHLGESNLFAFGVGPTVSRPVISLLARAGAGEPFIVDSMKDGAAVAAKLRRYVDRPLLTHIQLDTDTFDVSDLEPEALPDQLAAIRRAARVVGAHAHPAPDGRAGHRVLGRRRLEQQERGRDHRAGAELRTAHSLHLLRGGGRSRAYGYARRESGAARGGQADGQLHARHRELHRPVPSSRRARDGGDATTAADDGQRHRSYDQGSGWPPFQPGRRLLDRREVRARHAHPAHPPRQRSLQAPARPGTGADGDAGTG